MSDWSQVAGSLSPALHDLAGYFLPVIDQTAHSQEVDEHSGDVDLPGEFSDGVVVREDVVVVVKRFSQVNDRQQWVLCGVVGRFENNY